MSKKDSKSKWLDTINRSSTVRSYNFPSVVHYHLSKLCENVNDMIWDQDDRDDLWKEMQKKAISLYVKKCCSMISEQMESVAAKERKKVVARVFNPVTSREELELEDGTFVPLINNSPITRREDHKRISDICKQAVDDCLSISYTELKYDLKED